MLNSSKPITKRTFTYYSILFFIMCIAIYSYYFFIGGSFIWKSDGFTQHFQLFNEYVTMLQGLFKGQGFEQWDWSIGAGADTITSFGYYVIGDPFVYLGVFFPENLREFSFHLLIFIRMWCVGLSYLFFAKKFNVTHNAGLLGVIMYAFSFFVIFNVSRHPFFILPLIWYPLLCLGVEKILRKESGLLFSIAIAISAFANFYFFYKLTILTFIYGIVRYGFLYGFKNWLQSLRFFGRCLWYYVIGFLMSAIVFLPMVDGFLHSSRGAGETAINLFLYDKSYYITLIRNLFVPQIYLWSLGGLSIFTLFTAVFLWKAKKNKSFYGIMLLILSVFLLFPFFGSFMNGMSGPYNRFSFSILLFLAFASGQFLEERHKLQMKHFEIAKYLLFAFTYFYAVAAMIEDRYVFYIIPLLIGWLMWALLAYEAKRKFSNKISIALIALVVINMAANAMSLYYPYGNNSIANTIPLNTSIDCYKNVNGSVEKLLPKDNVYRVGVTSQDSHVRNQFIYHDLHGLSSYLSITNGYLAEFAKELQLSPFQLIQPLRNGVDDRRITNHFLNVEYILTNKANARYIPPGYDIVHRSKEKPSFIIAKTPSYFPFAYAEDTLMTRKNFSQLNPLAKEDFLTRGVVVEENTFSDMTEVNKHISQARNIKYRINYTNPKLKRLDDGSIDVTQKGAKLKIELENASELAGHELFIDVKGVHFETISQPVYIADNTSYDLTFSYEKRKKTLRQSDVNSFSTYFHRENMFVNLGYTTKGTKNVTIKFEKAGKYTIDDIVIYALPVDTAKDQKIAAIKHDNALNITTFDNEHIEGSIQREKASILTTTIPYAKGWRATVNNKPIETIRTNIGFIGIPLPAGHAKVIFTYQNPYVKMGGLLSLFGLIALLITQIVTRKKA